MSFHFFLPESRHFRTVFPLLNPIRSLGFVKLRAYAWQIASRPAEGVAGYAFSRAGRQMTAEVRKLAKGQHLTLLLNYLMTVLG